MADITSRFGFGGANINPGGTGKPTLATALRDIADDLAGSAGASRNVEETVPVASDVGLLMYEPEVIEYVDEGGVGGAKVRRAVGETLAAGEYKVDGSNTRHLDFAGADSVTSAKVGYRKAIEQPAIVVTDDETFDLDDGDELSLSVDGETEETATFETADFVDIDNATAAEVAAVIAADISGVTVEVIGAAVVVRSDTLGPDSTLQASGTAVAKLGLDEDEHTGSGVTTRKV